MIHDSNLKEWKRVRLLDLEWLFPLEKRSRAPEGSSRIEMRSEFYRRERAWRQMLHARVEYEAQDNWINGRQRRPEDCLQ